MMNLKCYVTRTVLDVSPNSFRKAIQMASLGTPFVVLMKSVEYSRNNHMFDFENVLLNTQ